MDISSRLKNSYFFYSKVICSHITSFLIITNSTLAGISAIGSTSQRNTKEEIIINCFFNSLYADTIFNILQNIMIIEYFIINVWFIIIIISWYLFPDIFCLIPVFWSLFSDLWSLIPDLWSLIPDLCSRIPQLSTLNERIKDIYFELHRRSWLIL